MQLQVQRHAYIDAKVLLKELENILDDFTADFINSDPAANKKSSVKHLPIIVFSLLVSLNNPY